MNRRRVCRLVKRITAAEDPNIFKKCALQTNIQETSWRTVRRLMKLKKVRSIILFSLDVLNSSRKVKLKKNQIFGREVLRMRDTGTSLTPIFTKIWEQIVQPKLQEIASGI